MPTVLGEKVVLRILDKSQLSFELENLGIRGRNRAAIEAMIRSPYGLMLVTGPTGSGKTTTLYSALDLLRSEATNIVTIEDPVEYQLPLINQIQVAERVGLTFVRALRSILRRTPTLLWSARSGSEDTARVAIQAALTGHLVLSTLHTNDCPGAGDADARYGHRAVLIVGRGVRLRCSAAGTEDMPVMSDVVLPAPGFAEECWLGTPQQ